MLTALNIYGELETYPVFVRVSTNTNDRRRVAGKVEEYNSEHTRRVKQHFLQLLIAFA